MWYHRTVRFERRLGMPLSKCRFCGKKVPNPYRPYHEKVQCIVARKARGEYVDPQTQKRQLKKEVERQRREAEEAKRRPQKTLTVFT
jgi:hypothetical protein